MQTRTLLRWILVAGVALVVLLGLGVWLQARAQAGACRTASMWVCGASMPTPRSEVPAAFADGRIWVPGGLGLGGVVHDAFEAYDPVRQSWTSHPSLPSPRHHAGFAAWDDRMYLSGGYASLRFGTGTSALHVFDPAAGAWTSLAEMPGPRAAHAAVALADRIWIVGGVGAHRRELWAYDPASDTWETGFAPLPTAREHLSAVAFEDELWVIGGRWDGQNFATVEIYDPRRGAWRTGPELPAPRGGLTAAAVDGAIHAAGGESLSGGAVYADHWALVDEAAGWQVAERLPTGRHGLASASANGRWYVIGGATRAGAQTVVSAVGTVNVWSPNGR